MKAQLSVEILLIFILVIFAVLVVFLILPTNIMSINMDQEQRIAKQTVEKIVENSEFIYLTANNSLIYIDIEIPQGFDYSQSYIGYEAQTNDWELKKNIKLAYAKSFIIKTSLYPICGKFPTMPGRYKIKLEYNSTPPHVMINDNC